VPAAHAILFFLATFVALWGLTLIVRGLLGGRVNSRRCCPECRAPMQGVPGLTCNSCGFQAGRDADFRVRAPRWPLVCLGALAIVGGVIAGSCGVYVYRWTCGSDGDIALTLWNSAAAATAVFWSAVLIWAIRGERSKGRRRCNRCLYDMRGLDSLTCPECGWQAVEIRDLYRPRRRRRWALVAIFGILSSFVVWGLPRYQRGGIPALVPSTVLIAGFEWLPHGWVLDAGTSRQTWTLQSRRYESLWPWQERWLRARCGRLWRNSNNYAALERVLYLYHPESPADKARLVERTIAGLSSTDTAQRDAAANFFLRTMWLARDADRRPIIAALGILRPMLESPTLRIRVAAAMLLVNVPGEMDAALRTLAASGGDPRLASLVVYTLRDSGRTPEGRAVVVSLASSPDPQQRALAAQALTRFPTEQIPEDAETSRILRDLLADPDAQVVASAANALVRSRAPGAVQAIAQALAEERGDPVRLIHALEDAAWDGDISAALSAVVDCLESTPAARGAAEAFLTARINQRSPIDDVVPRIQALSQSSAPDIAGAAARILRAHKDTTTPP
jgi:hypothetical protein